MTAKLKLFAETKNSVRFKYQNAKQNISIQNGVALIKLQIETSHFGKITDLVDRA